MHAVYTWTHHVSVILWALTMLYCTPGLWRVLWGGQQRSDLLSVLLAAIAAIWAIARPDDVTVLANWLGVDRGTDLMLYVLVVAFFFVTISTWTRFREQELRYARLARAVALQNAQPPSAVADERH